MVATQPDVFALARERFTIPEAWDLLGLEGDPKPGANRSPWREDRNPSFSIFDGGLAWKDHASGEGGDVIEFVRVALGTDYQGVRDWFAERVGVAPVRRPVTSKKTRGIEFPEKLIEGTAATWDGFARSRGLPYSCVWTAVQAGLLRFTRIKGAGCFVITDEERRAAEIRRLDGKPFGSGSKAFPLRGVDKEWPVGAELLRHAPPSTGVLVTEGPTDMLSALNLLCRYLRNLRGTESWVPVAILGASCRKLAPEAVELIQGRRVRLAFDGDESGRKAADHWGDLFSGIGCDVDRLNLPDGRDIRDMAETGEIEPGDIYS